MISVEVIIFVYGGCHLVERFYVITKLTFIYRATNFYAMPAKLFYAYCKKHVSMPYCCKVSSPTKTCFYAFVVI